MITAIQNEYAELTTNDLLQIAAYGNLNQQEATALANVLDERCPKK